jgi:hypothetical protein
VRDTEGFDRAEEAASPMASVTWSGLRGTWPRPVYPSGTDSTLKPNRLRVLLRVRATAPATGSLLSCIADGPTLILQSAISAKPKA